MSSSLHVFLACVVLYTSFAISISTGLTNVPPNITNAVELGYATDNSFNPYIFRDGGGGGYVNGYHVFSFSDSFTTTGNINSSLTSFVHNTFAYFGYIDENDPTQMYDFGSKPNPNNGYRYFKGTLAANIGNETNLTHTTISIWPNSNMIELLNGKQGLAVYSVYNATYDSQIFYNTMITIDIEDPVDVPDGQTLNATRVVPRLFYGNENLYGSFSTYRFGASGSKQEPVDSHLYLFATSANGIKVARVPLLFKTERAFYTYWDGTSWSPQQPSVDDTASNLISFQYSYNLTTNSTDGNNTTITTIYGPYGPGSGDVFWSPFFNTFVCVFQAIGVDSNFYLSYSTTQSLTSGWSEPLLIWATPAGADPMCVQWEPNWELDYCGHAYPSWDMTGQTILLSYSACDGWTVMLQVTFDDFAGVVDNANTTDPVKKSPKVKTKSVKTETTKTQVASTSTSLNGKKAKASKTKQTLASTSSRAARSSSTSTVHETTSSSEKKSSKRTVTTTAALTSHTAAVSVRKRGHGHQHMHKRNNDEEHILHKARSSLVRLSRRLLRREDHAVDEGEL